MPVSQDHLIGVLTQAMEPIAGAVTAGSDDGELSADDLIDLFALGIAAIIDNDTHLATPRHIRLAIETAGKRIKVQTERLRALREQTGESLLSQILPAAGGATGTIN